MRRTFSVSSLAGTEPGAEITAADERTRSVARITEQITAAVETWSAKDLMILSSTLWTCQMQLQARFMELLHKAKDPVNRLLKAKEAADILGMDVRWIYRHAYEMKSARRPSPGKLRFDREELLEEFKVGR
jgi:hypothetical protein